MEILPAIDLIGGKCVRLTQGDYNQVKQYNEDPLAVAKSFEAAGLKRLHLVDLDGAKQKQVVNHQVLEKITSQTSLKVDFGGGIQSQDDIQRVFDCGASQVTGGSIAVRQPKTFAHWLQTFGPEKIILGADARNGEIAISGWSEKTRISVYDFVGEWRRKGVQYVISTEVSRDGMMEGPSFLLYKRLRSLYPDLKIIASGGVSKMNDVLNLQSLGIFGVIVGKAIYEGTTPPEELAKLGKKVEG